MKDDFLGVVSHELGKGHEREVLSGLKGGAADYVVKPFSLKELAARVELALRKELPP